MFDSLEMVVAAVRHRLVLAGLVIGAGVVVATMSSVNATEPLSDPVIRVEEDWKLVLNKPDDATNAPQFHTVMSPNGNTASVYFQASWNYWEKPNFESGGLQLQAWDRDECVQNKGFLHAQQLSTDAETITWTQVMETNSEALSLQIVSGQSATWGAFGGDSMKVQGDVHVSHLNGYTPDVSVKNSWVTYGANRVDLLVIKEVRYYGARGLLHRDTAPKVIFKLASH